jgi:hypothetical protein
MIAATVIAGGIDCLTPSSYPLSFFVFFTLEMIPSYSTAALM